MHFQTYSARLIATLIVGAALTLVLGATSALAGPGSGGIGYGSGSEAQPSGSGSSGGADNRTPSKYNRLWDRVAPDDRDWARKVSWCESGRDPDAAWPRRPVPRRLHVHPRRVEDLAEDARRRSDRLLVPDPGRGRGGAEEARRHPPLARLRLSFATER